LTRQVDIALVQQRIEEGLAHKKDTRRMSREQQKFWT